MSEKEKRSWWDSFGKLFRGRKEEVPEDMDYCDNCGKIVPKEEIHEIVNWMNTGESLHICSECIELPPSSWRNAFGYNRKRE